MRLVGPSGTWVNLDAVIEVRVKDTTNTGEPENWSICARYARDGEEIEAVIAELVGTEAAAIAEAEKLLVPVGVLDI